MTTSAGKSQRSWKVGEPGAGEAAWESRHERGSMKYGKTLEEREKLAKIFFFGNILAWAAVVIGFILFLIILIMR